ncbi:rhomboid family intramembrane serine protease GlpG [Alteromonas sp. CYL-A6]|uniref:rhomboid family intramembrane serine protease GlpG n=1 Tax=Alteromonas nitratireducens TaxID=3390813 RepID=UPI0034B221D0
MSVALIAFGQEGPAHLLANYLRSQHIEARVETDGEGTFTVTLARQEDVEKARIITEAFIADPGNEKYQQAAWQQGEGVRLSKRSARGSTQWLENARRAPFTALMFAACLIIYVLSVFGLFGTIAQHLMMQPLPVLLENHQWWRLIGPALIHFSILHIVFNLLWWSVLGAQVERTLGVSMLLILFVVSAVISNIAQSFFSAPVGGYLLPFGGLSGVVYALMGFVWWLGWLKPNWGLSLNRSIVGFMLVWLVLGYADILWVNMANAAHTAGLITGCAMAALLSIGADRRSA